MNESREVAVAGKGDQWDVRNAGHVQPFIPDGFASVFKFSELIASSGMAPKGYDTPEKIATAIFMGMEVGLTPMNALQSIAVINGKPSIYGDGALALVRASGLMEEFKEYTTGEFGTDGYTAYCYVKRRGEEPIIGEFSIDDAKRANLWNKEGPWRHYTKRMLKMRARSFALRDGFTDVLRGLAIFEEAMDIDPYDITPRRGLEPPDPDDDGSEPSSSTESGDAPRKRGRPKKVQPVNKYQGDGGDVIDVKANEPESAETKTVAAEPEKAAAVVEKTKPAEERKPVEERKPTEAPKPATTPTRQKAVISIVDGFEALPDSIKSMLERLHSNMARGDTLPAIRNAWTDLVVDGKRPWSVQYDAAFEAVKDWHKRRVESSPQKTGPAPGDDNPPAPESDNPPAPDDGEGFDFDGFVEAVKAELGRCETEDAVTRVITDMTELPLRDRMISQQQFEEMIQPLGIAAMERLASS